MSINSALAAGASGLVANSSALAAISDNIANVNTVGYKRVDTVFTPNYRISGGGEIRYASSGVASNSRLDVNSAGLLNPGTSPTDLAIDGAGFFVVRPTPTNASGADAVLFTRSGSFETDNEGFLRNDAGQYLFAWPVRADGSVSLNPSNLNDLEAVNLSNIGGTAQATGSVRINANLQASQAVSPAAATYAAGASATNMASGAVTPDFQRTIQVFDTQGGVRSITMSLLKSTTANQWHAELHVDPASDVTTGAGLVDGQIATGILAFDTDGVIDPAASTLPTTLNFLGSNNTAALGATDVQWAAVTGVGSQSIALDFGAAALPAALPSLIVLPLSTQRWPTARSSGRSLAWKCPATALSQRASPTVSCGKSIRFRSPPCSTRTAWLLLAAPASRLQTIPVRHPELGPALAHRARSQPLRWRTPMWTSRPSSPT